MCDMCGSGTGPCKADMSTTNQQVQALVKTMRTLSSAIADATYQVSLLGQRIRELEEE